MAHRLLRDPDADGWERSDFPIVCETCLGPNPYVRMQRIEFGGTCHISGRPYTVFRWRPGNEARYKKTIICQEVAKAKNVCQVCLLDLDYGLPVQVRDTALGIENDDLPESDVGKEYQLNEKIKAGETDSSFSQQRPNDLILQLQRTTPYYKRNQAPICTFFVRGQCNRGAECPYRHEMPTTGELAEQNIKDRYYGINDPVAKKLLRRAGEMPKLISPEDQSIMTLYVGGLSHDITEDDIKDQFYHFGELKSIKKIDTRNCAFVTFTTRHAAEQAAEELYNKLIIKGVRCKLDWGKPQPNAVKETQSEPDPMQPTKTTKLTSSQAEDSSGKPDDSFNLPASNEPAYPSMDPTAMGSIQPSSSGTKRPASDDAGPSGSGSEDKRARTTDAGAGPSTAPQYSTVHIHRNPPPGVNPQVQMPMPGGTAPPMHMPPPGPQPGGAPPPAHMPPPTGAPPPAHMLHSGPPPAGAPPAQMPRPGVPPGAAPPQGHMPPSGPPPAGAPPAYMPCSGPPPGVAGPPGHMPPPQGPPPSGVPPHGHMPPPGGPPGSSGPPGHRPPAGPPPAGHMPPPGPAPGSGAPPGHRPPGGPPPSGGAPPGHMPPPGPPGMMPPRPMPPPSSLMPPPPPLGAGIRGLMGPPPPMLRPPPPPFNSAGLRPGMPMGPPRPMVPPPVPPPGPPR